MEDSKECSWKRNENEREKSRIKSITEEIFPELEKWGRERSV